jgi:hypothetical protein
MQHYCLLFTIEFQFSFLTSSVLSSDDARDNAQGQRSNGMAPPPTFEVTMPTSPGIGHAPLTLSSSYSQCACATSWHFLFHPFSLQALAMMDRSSSMACIRPVEIHPLPLTVILKVNDSAVYLTPR